MKDERTSRYSRILGDMLRKETVSSKDDPDNEKFHEFRELLKELFPNLFSKGYYKEFSRGFVLKWEGADPDKEPVLLMNHHDVVEAGGEWRIPPFSGAVDEDRLWGRGAIDDKGGLFAMLQAAEELISEGFVPDRTVWFFSSSTEETDGSGADEVSRWFESEGIRFMMLLDEGGYIVYEPVPGAKTHFALIGLGEKGCADLKFIARSRGGHASMPGTDSPLVRLGKFMAAADNHRIFTVSIHPAVCEMLKIMAPHLGTAGKLLEDPKRHNVILKRALPAMSPKMAAILRTTIAFTMAKGSDGTNVLPTEAWVIANMRYSHHQGQERSFEAIRKLAAKYDLEMEILDPGNPSKMASYKGKGYRLIKRSVEAVFPGVTVSPYLMTGASDARYFDRVCDQCIRFLPFKASDDQLEAIHGLNENIDMSALAPAVDFYTYLIRHLN